MNLQKPLIASEGIPKDLILIQEMLFDNCKFEIKKLTPEPESSEYGACTFSLNNLNILFRTAKITPTKTGQFVTLWKRINQGPIQPFDSTDPIDLFMVSTRTENHFGVFIFPKSILITKEIVSDKKEGKRAIRVYPPWDITTSKQARKTQNWQLDYFLKIQNNNSFNIELANQLIIHQIK
jgi:hypothetical protein